MKKHEAILGVFLIMIYIMWKFPKFRKLGVPWGTPGHHPSHDHDLVGLSIFRSPMLRNHSKLGICFQLSNMVTNLVTHFGMFSLTLVTPFFCLVGASDVTRVLSSRPRPKSPFWKLLLDEMGGRKHPGERPGLPIIMANGNSNNMDILYYNPDILIIIVMDIHWPHRNIIDS